MKTRERPALRYHGSKWLLAPWIIEHFPAHRCYVEPYGGAAAVLLRKPRSWMEVYNDLDDQVVNYFRVLRDQSEELIEAIRLTPYAYVEWELSLLDDPDPVEMARRFYVRSLQGIAGPTAQWRTGWRRQRITAAHTTPGATTFARIGHLQLLAERLRGVQIERKPALETLAFYDSPDTLFYLDPPYPRSTRSRWGKTAYAYEMTDEQHAELARAAHDLQGMVIVSGYQCPLYDELYADWERDERQARTNSQYGTAAESLWLSPNAVRAKLPLFNT